MTEMKDMFETATEINGVVFYLGPVFDDGQGDQRVVFTQDGNHHIDPDEDIQLACERLYNDYYATT